MNNLLKPNKKKFSIFKNKLKYYQQISKKKDNMCCLFKKLRMIHHY